MQYVRKCRESSLPSRRTGVLFVLLAIVTTSLTGCEDERQKAWREWREEHDKLDYRCGMFGDYEFRINRAYLFFWPTYQGRSDWVVQGPPPWGCSGKLETVPIEAYWPGLRPAGYHTEENLNDPDRILISIEALSNRDRWDFVSNLERLFGSDWRRSDYQKNKDKLGLDYAKGRDWLFPDNIFNYYWIEEPDGRISTFITCDDLDSSIRPKCTHLQYIPEAQAVLEIQYREKKLIHWKQIGKEVRKFIKARLHRNPG